MAFYRIRGGEPANAVIGVSTLTPVEVSASATAVDLVAANPDRKSLSLINESPYELLVNTGEVATPANQASNTNKIKIIPGQTEYTFELNELPLEALNGIWVGSATPTGVVVVVEGE